MILHIISDLATPHNNSLVSALRSIDGLRVITWYAMKTSVHLPWEQELGGVKDNHYFDSWQLRKRLIWCILTNPADRYLFVGYSNIVSRIAILIMWILRRPFLYWTDNPRDNNRYPMHKALRKLSYLILRTGCAHMFVVGEHTVARFKVFGFRHDQLTNLPIFIDLPKISSDLYQKRSNIREKYGVPTNKVLFVGASRLVFEKGYDLLIYALGKIDKSKLALISLLIVGSGPEENKLRDLVKTLKLDNLIFFESWLSAEDYGNTIAAADVFVHPARFDAFGGGTLTAMAMGVPVIGSDCAGSVIERVKHGLNGLIYPQDDIDALARCIIRILDNEDERKRMGLMARKTAEEWPPIRGAQIVYSALRK